MKKRVPNEWTKLEYFDPEIVLPKLRKIREHMSDTDTPEKIANLRTNTLKNYRESWDAAIFSQLLSLTIGQKILFSRYEDSDFDSIFTWNDNGTQCYAPIQLKELVPEYTNTTATLNDILIKLCKYSGHDDLIVGIKLNRRKAFDLTKISTENLPIYELWMFGATSEDQSHWRLFGEFMSGTAEQYEYELPYV
jgi:hypothetical protein